MEREKERMCPLCNNAIDNDSVHKSSEEHRFNFLLFQWENKRRSIVKDRHGIQLSIKPLPLNGFRSQFQTDINNGTHALTITPSEMAQHNNKLQFECTIRNIMRNKSVTIVKAHVLYSHDYFSLCDKAGHLERGKYPELPPGTSYTLTVTLQIPHVMITNFKIPFGVTLQTVEANPIHFPIARSIIVSIGEHPSAEIVLEKSPFTSTMWDRSVTVIPSSGTKPFPDTFQIPERYMVAIYTALQRGPKDTLLEILEKLEPGYVTRENYRDFLKIMLWMEEAWLRTGLSRYNMENVTITLDGDRYLCLNVPGLAEKRPSVIKGDQIHLRLHLDHTGYAGVIEEVRDSSVLISKVNQQLLTYLKNYPDMELDVRFVLGRLTFERMHSAVEKIGNSEKLLASLFPSQQIRQKPGVKTIFIADQDFANQSVVTNLQQKQAVQNIVNNTSRSVPYIVFGPPGTGKTVTIVEAMVQLLRLTKKRMLVCTPSNAAGNMLLSKLMPYCKPSQLIRVMSENIDLQLITPEMVPYTNYLESESVFIKTTPEDLMKRRIVITTLILAGRYSTSYHPDVVFVDEAAQAMEPEVAVPIALLGAGKQIVLAGDPKQLGPSVGSPKAQEYKLDISLLERLMGRELYLPDPDYDANFITMLEMNFRNHSDILRIPNKLFYQNRLQPVSISAHADPLSRTRVYQRIRRLVPKGNNRKYTAPLPPPAPLDFTPCEFCGVLAQEKREGRSPSYFNTTEMHMVVFYVETLCNLTFGDPKWNVKQEQIGVITPYIRQVYKIKNMLKNKFPLIEVGTTETFQGREKRIIIISTVRAQMDLLLYDKMYKLGFVKNEKRFNVALTRAKSKIIVIGNPLVLRTDEKWNAYIAQCESSNSAFGPAFEPRNKRKRKQITRALQTVISEEQADS